MPNKTTSLDLSGKCAVVTGASRGIGRAIALRLRDNGAEVIAVARVSEDLTALGAEVGISIWPFDVADPDFHDRLSKTSHDILVNNAGTNQPMPMKDVPVEVLDKILGLNVRCAYLVAQASVRAMLAEAKGGSIIHITSQMGHVGSPNRTVYCMTKHALEGLTKAMAVELAPHNIRVNAVAPTFVETPMTAPMLKDPEFMAFVMANIPLGRSASLEEVAQAVAYLVSDGASIVTGTSLKIDGGWTAQ
jgi:NAD(P)-dependent dehydrogenase (short-subunit alcohol dehydrogenase family)